jgi:hypothetical protein
MNRFDDLRINFWTLTKNIDDIKVDEETKKQIEELRMQARVLSLESKEINSKFCIKDNAVVFQKEDVAAFYKNWDEMAEIRLKIESLINKKKKKLWKIQK